MKSIIAFILACTLFAPAQAASLAKMAVFEAIKVEQATGKPVTAEQVRRAILTAARARGWTAQDEGQGRVSATILVRGRFRVSIDIPYSAREFSVSYVSSENLDYRLSDNGPEIHRNYNKWIATLVNDIKAQLILI